VGSDQGEGLAGEECRGFAGAAGGCAQGPTRIAGVGVGGAGRGGTCHRSAALLSVSPLNLALAEVTSISLSVAFVDDDMT